MTSDKQNASHLASKPFTPSLSAAFHRSSKSPLTPKLATPSPGGHRTPRRVAQSELPSSTATTPSKDDHHHSPAQFLSANVTPRSNSRVSRRDVPIGSPTSIPSGTLSAPQTPYSQSGGVTPGSQNGGTYRTERSPVRTSAKLEPPRTSRARTLTAESLHSSRPVPSSPDVSSGSKRFFHASDASRSSNSPDPEPRAKPSGKSSSSASFFYANGQEDRPPEEEANATIAAIGRRSGGPSRSVASSRPPPVSASASASPRFRSSRGAESGRLSDNVLAQPVPPDDPVETASHRQSAPANNVLERPPPVPIRRHIKSSSVDSGSTSFSPREGLRPSPILVSPSDPQVPQIDPSAAATETIPSSRPRIFSNGSSGSAETHALASPIKSETPGQANNDPAANARVERKIMDLEISNSSLLAINRTLEREMRKQHGELRRFKRLSRAGHFSVAPGRSASGPTTLSTTPEAGEAVSSAIPSVQTPDDLSDVSDGDDEDSSDEGVMSPGSLAEHDAKHRVSDEKHVFTDIAKHQELLLDSQKINQSLRRCLGWTEELIKEGQKALEYNVHVNDVELGGRVLAPEELLDIGESARGLLSSSSAASDFNKSDLSSTASSYEFETDSVASTGTATDIA